MKDRILYGVGLLLLGHALQVVAYFAISAFEQTSGPIPTSFLILIGFGALQGLYVLPGLIFFVVTRRARAAITLFIGALLTGGANALFWAVFFAGGNLVP